MNDDDRENIFNNILNLKDQQNDVINQINDGKSILTECFHNIKSTSSFVANFSRAAEARFNDIYQMTKQLAVEREKLEELSFTVNNYQHDVDALLQLISTKRISGKLINHEKLENAYNTLLTKITDEQLFPFNDILTAVIQKEADIKFTQQIIIITLNAPISSRDSWRFFKTHLFPVIQDSTLIVVEAQEKFIALTKDDSTVTINDIASCYRNLDNEYICAFLDTIVLKATHSCITNAFHSKTTSSEACAANTHAAKIVSTTIIRFSQDEILILPVESKCKLHIKCDDDSNFETIITKNTLISSRSSCLVNINEDLSAFLIHDNIIKTKINIRTEMDININDKPWEHPVLPKFESATLEDINLLGSRIRKLNEKHLKTTTIDLHSEAQTWKYSSTTVIIALVVLLVILITCWCHR